MIDEDRASWGSDEFTRAPTWLRRVAVYGGSPGDPAEAGLFGRVVGHFRSLEHLEAPLDRDLSATAQIEALVAKHRDLRSLGVMSAVVGLDTASLGALPLERVEFSGRLLRDAAGSWSAGLGKVREVMIGAREPVRVGEPAAWAGLVACESLTLRRLSLDGPSMRAIAGLPRLRRLSLVHCALAPRALAELGKSAALRRLTITGNAVGSADAAALARAPGLEVAFLSVGTGKDAAALRPLGERGIHLGVGILGRTYLDDALVAAICGALPGLRGLSLDQHQIVGLTKKLTPGGLAAIAALGGLRWLSLDGLYVRGIRPADLGWIGGLPELRSLSLRHAGKLSAAVVDSLVGARSLAALDLRGIALSDAAVKKLGSLRLRTLAVDGVKFGPKGFGVLAAIPTLRELSVGHAKGFTDPMVAALAAGTALEWLNLEASVTVKEHPTTLAPLAGLPALRSLAIAEVGIRDAWLGSLVGAPALASLRITRSDASFSGGSLGDAAVDAGLAIPTLETISHWGHRPSAAAQVAIEAAGRGAWIPGDYGRWLSVEPITAAPLGEHEEDKNN